MAKLFFFFADQAIQTSNKQHSRYHELKDDLHSFFTTYRWKCLLVGIAIGMAAGFWVKALQLRPIFALLLSGSLYFFSYGFFMLKNKEELVMEFRDGILRKRF